MGLETFSYITSLNVSNPVHATDQVSQGDDHLRGIKLALTQSFPNVNAAVTLTPTEFNYLDGVTGVTGSGSLALSASPTFTGILTAAAIAATTYGGIAEANLVDKSAAETISGSWTFGALAATSYDGIAAANLVDKSAAETVTGTWGFNILTANFATITSLNIANTDLTLSRKAASTLAVEGDAVFSHDSASYSSAKIFFSNGTEPTTEGNNGDLFLVY